MSSGPAHPGILVGVDGFAVIKGCCAVSRARGNGAQCSAHPRARRMHARGQLIGSVLANGPKYLDSFVVQEVDDALPPPGIVEFHRGAAARVCDVALDCDDPRHLLDGLGHGVDVLV